MAKSKKQRAGKKKVARGHPAPGTVQVGADTAAPWWACATGAWADTESRTYADLSREERARLKREAPSLYDWLRGSKKREVLEIRMRPRRRKDVSVRFLMARHDTPQVETLEVVYGDPPHTSPPRRYETVEVVVGHTRQR